MNTLHKINDYYHNKFVTIITVPILSSPIQPQLIPNICSGFFLEANEIGIFILTITGKKDFFYHEKIIKIEEAEEISKEISEDVKEKLSNNKQEFNCTDQQKNMEMLEEVRNMVLKRKEENKNMQLHERPKFNE